MTTDLFDPTFNGLQSNERKPVSYGKVLSLVSGREYLVQFDGREINATSADLGGATIGDSVSIAQVGDKFWIVGTASVGYPTRWARPLSDFTTTNPAGAFVRYILDGNDREYTYQEAVVVRSPSATKLICDCWDGERREMEICYGSLTVAQGSSFAVGDRVLCYQPSAGGTKPASPAGRWEIVGGYMPPVDLQLVTRFYGGPSHLFKTRVRRTLMESGPNPACTITVEPCGGTAVMGTDYRQIAAEITLDEDAEESAEFELFDAPAWAGEATGRYFMHRISACTLEEGTWRYPQNDRADLPDVDYGWPSLTGYHGLDVKAVAEDSALSLTSGGIEFNSVAWNRIGGATMYAGKLGYNTGNAVEGGWYHPAIKITGAGTVWDYVRKEWIDVAYPETIIPEGFSTTAVREVTWRHRDVAETKWAQYFGIGTWLKIEAYKP